MNINLNLATRPYIELRPVYARLRVLAGALLVLALPMLLVVHTEEAKARLAEARVNQLESNIALLRRQQASARALALEGPNANVLNEAAFLNDLFRRKAFSWTATMVDLENTLPYGVQVQAIDPVVSPDGHVTIRMRVTGGRERAVDVVHNLERSRHFIAPRLVSEALANQNSGNARGAVPVSDTGGAASDVNFDILADYRPLPNSHTGPHEKSMAVAERPPSARAQLTNPDPRPAAVVPERQNPGTPVTQPTIPAQPAPPTVRPPHAAQPFGRPLPTLPAPIGANN